MRKKLFFVLLGLLLVRTMRGSPVFALVAGLLFNRRVRRLAALLLFEFINNPRIRHLITSQIVRRLRFW